MAQQDIILERLLLAAAAAQAVQMVRMAVSTLPVVAATMAVAEPVADTNSTHLLGTELLQVLAVLAVVVQSALFGPAINVHSQQQTPATYECAGFGYCL